MDTPLAHPSASDTPDNLSAIIFKIVHSKN